VFKADLGSVFVIAVYPNFVLLGQTSKQGLLRIIALFCLTGRVFAAAAPATYADKHDPPLVIIQGTADTVVDVKQSKDLADALAKAGTPHQLVIVEGAPHGFHLQPEQQDLRPIVLGFFDKHLKGKP
jgi:alpha-beta hydrolase superfamily lysophospholipase